MKCILIHRPGPWGTLVHISRGLQLKTHEYLRTHRDSSIWPLRGRDAGLCALTPSWCTFSNFDLCRSLGQQHFKSLALFCCWIFFPGPLYNLRILFCYHRVSNLPAVSRFCGFRKPLRQMKGWALVFSPALPCPASGLPACGGDWDAVDDAAAGSSFALITPREPTVVWFRFLQPSRIFHISDVNVSSNPPPTLLIKFAPYAFEGRWTDWQACFSLTPLPCASGLIRPQPWWGQALQSWDSIMFPKLPDWR